MKSQDSSGSKQSHPAFVADVEPCPLGRLKGYTNGAWMPAITACLDVLYPQCAGRFVDSEDLELGARMHMEVADALRRDTTVFTPYFRVNRLLEYLNRRKLAPLLIETPLRSRHGYAGRPDAVMRDPDGQLWVCEWKFAEGLMARNFCQVEAESRLVVKGRPFKKLLVQVNKQGEVNPLEPKDDTRRWHAFLAAVHVIHYQLNEGGPV